MSNQTAHFEKEHKDYLKKLGLRIVKLRKKNKMSRATLAELSQLNTQYLLDVESGRKNPGIYVVAKLARAFNVPVSELLKSLDLKPIEE